MERTSSASHLQKRAQSVGKISDMGVQIGQVGTILGGWPTSAFNFNN